MTGADARGATSRHDAALRIALLSYRARPFCGGQGVYIRNLSRELARLGHHVEVVAGQPYPVLDDGVELTRLASLDLYADAQPFRRPGLSEFRDIVDVVEYAHMCSGGFPEPLTFTLRAWRNLRTRTEPVDVVHDNQSLGYGLLGVQRLGLPVLATVHHPITVDRRLELAAASRLRRLSLHRWYGFVRMQRRVAARLPRVLTVSAASAADIRREMGLASERVHVVPIGVDPTVFAPGPARVPGRLVTTASADVPLKGLPTLLEALAKLRTEHDDAHLVVVGRSRPGGVTERTVRRLGLENAVRFVHDVSQEQLVEQVATASVAVVPSVYEGFSLPAVEAMACQTPLVATTGGALPEVVGDDEAAGLLVPPSDPGALAAALGRLLADADLRARLGVAGRERVLRRFTWQAAAAATVQHYRQVIAEHQGRPTADHWRTPAC